MWPLTALTFVVTRPVVVPVAVVASGLTYGSYKISKRVGASLFRTDTADAGFTNYAIGALSGLGTLSLRNLLSPAITQQSKSVFRDLSLSSMRAGKRIVGHHARSLALSGIVAGLAAAYTLPPLQPCE